MNQQTPSGISPSPQDQVPGQHSVENQPTPPNQQPGQFDQPSQPLPHKSNTLKIVLILLGSCLVLTVIIILVFVLMVNKGLEGARSKAKDQTIKSSISSLQAETAVYYDEHQSYKGFAPSDYTKQQVEAAGSKIIVQGLSDTNFVIYAQLPNSKKYWCIDNEFTGKEMEYVHSSAIRCMIAPQ